MVQFKITNFPAFVFALPFFLFPFFISAQPPLIAALEWEAESYVPPAYSGRALAAPGAVVSVALIPEPGLKERDLAVDWQLDDGRLAGADPFYARFIVTREAGARQSVTVRVRDKIRNSVDTARLEIPVAAPEVFVHSAEGQTIAPYALGPSVSVPGGTSVKLAARAYFFPGAAAPFFRWSSDGAALAGAPRSPQFLTIKAPARLPEAIKKVIQAIAQHSRFSQLVATKEIRLEIR